VNRGVDNRRLKLENARLRTEAAIGRPIIARARAPPRARSRDARRPKDVTVLLTGESGVGKDVLALRSTRIRSAPTSRSFAQRRRDPSRARRVGALRPLEGSFTGATDTRKGYFQQADKGTLFIDEIGELPLAIQAKVLRALQSARCSRSRSPRSSTSGSSSRRTDLAAEARAGASAKISSTASTSSRSGAAAPRAPETSSRSCARS